MYININELKAHPRNSEFFDDMTGESWREFLTSIRESNGPVEPIVVTPDHIIVSGHQRVRACRELGIDNVECKVVELGSEDDVLRVLIETNIRQRGIGNPNPVKFGRCIRELERIYGIRNGGDRKSEAHNEPLMSQDDLAKELGVSKAQLKRYKSLTDLIPELQDAVMSGQITPTTAMGFVKRLSLEEQHKLAEQIAGQEKVSGAEVEAQIKAIKDENAKLRQQLNERPTIEVEVTPPDYEDYKKECATANRELAKVRQENSDLKDRLKKEDTLQDQAVEDFSNFVIATYNYIKRYGGNSWGFNKWGSVSEKTKKEVRDAIRTLNGFSYQMSENLKEVDNGEE